MWYVVHELRHAFKAAMNNRKGIDVYSELSKWRSNHPGYPDRTEFTGQENETGPSFGFASLQNQFTWQQSLSGTDNEEFADQFLGWAFNRWENSADGRFRSDMMNENMLLWVNLVTGRK